MVNLGDISVQKARDYLACRGVTDESVINATIDMTGRRIKLMDEVARVTTTPGRSLEGTCITASRISGAVLSHPLITHLPSRDHAQMSSASSSFLSSRS